jgi:hypothetical protein
MTRTTTVIIAALGAAVLGTAAASGAFAQTASGAARSAATEFSAQSRAEPGRARTRIRVAPRYPYRTYSTDFPVQYPYEYPGPGFVRECTSWLAPENRLSGPVIVPKMRCWWQPGT